MGGLAGFAPIYLNGVLALFCVFVLPGLLFVRAFEIPGFPQRLFIIFLSSLAANHFFVTLIAAFHLDPLQTYRIAISALVAILALLMVKDAFGSGKPAGSGTSTVFASDIACLLIALAVICLTYVNVWKHGVPNIFNDGDVAVSWNPWALLWSEGKFPIKSGGYPQFVPTIWAVPYIFMGSKEQYFAFYIYIVLIIVPLVLNAVILGRMGRWYPVLQGIAFVWLIAEIREPWLRATLPQAFPDWVAAIFAFCGTILFVESVPDRRGFDRETITSSLIALCLVSIAAGTKPIYGLLAVAILIGICTDAWKNLGRSERNKFIIAATGLLSLFAVAYAINYAHLTARGMPNYPVATWSERLYQAFKLVNSNFTIPFRILILAGFVTGPFIPRVRWLALPMWIGTLVWANTAAYDLRNVLGLLLISAFIPLHAIARAKGLAPTAPDGARWRIFDAGVAAALAVMTVGLTLTLATGDSQFKERFANDQLRSGSGIEFNRNIAKLLARGCTIFSATGYISMISAFEPFRDQMRFFFFTLPLDQPLTDQFNASTGCTSIFYPPSLTHPSILNFIATYAEARGLKKIGEAEGMVLMVSPEPQRGASARD
jgi:hypothetical protein